MKRISNHVRALLLLSLLLGLFSGLRPAQAAAGPHTGPYRQTAFLQPETLGSLAELGSAVALDGPTLAVGAPAGNNDTPSAVYIYAESSAGWELQQTLFHPNGRTFSAFGAALSLEGEVLAVGAPSDTNPGSVNGGVVYLYGRSGAQWNLLLTLYDPQGTEYAGFGVDVVLRDDTLFVLAPGYRETAQVVVFRRNGITWENALLVGRLSVPGELVTSRGVQLAATGDALVVGGPVNGGPGFAAIFERPLAGWQGTLLPSAIIAAHDASGQPNGYGAAVALWENALAVGAPSAGGQGAVYLYTRPDGGWGALGPQPVPAARLSAPDGSSGDNFGTALALGPGGLLIGAPNADHVELNAGRVYRFTQSGGTWTAQPAVDPPNAEKGALFGVSLALEGSRLVAGARLWPTKDAPAGAALVFQQVQLLVEPALIRVLEGGSAGMRVGVRLGAPPTDPVDMQAVVDEQLLVSPSTLTFTPDNWDTWQYLALMGREDSLVESLVHPSELSFRLTSADTAYAALIPAAVPVEIQDNDQPAVYLPAVLR